MNIEIYTRDGCSRCTSLKKILHEKDVEYTEHIIGETVTREQVLEMYPSNKMLPIVVVDSVVLSNSDSLLTMIKGE